MKKLFTILLLLISATVFGQSWISGGTLQLQQGSGYNNVRGSFAGKGNFQWYTAAQVDSLLNMTSLISGPVTSIPVVGYNPGTNLTSSQWILAAFYQTQPPTASLSGGTVFELGISNQTHNLSYSYGRQFATTTIASAIINPGSLNVFSTQPAQPGTVSGTQSVTTSVNTNTTYTITVTTSDSKTATATTTDTWLPRAYWGRTSTNVPDNAIILAVAGGGNVLSNSRSQTFTVSASGSNYIYFAYPASEGALTSITVGGFQSIGAFTQNTVSLTNASGYIQSYYVYVSNNTFSATSPTIITQ